MKASISTAEAEPLLGHRRAALARHSARRKWNQFLTILAAILLFMLGLDLLFSALCELSYEVKPVSPKIQLPGSIKRSWAQYTPYFSMSEYTKPPNDCRITQVNILQRHGARFPASNENEPESVEAALASLKSASVFLDPRLEFIKDYTYKLGKDDLVAFGAAQSFDTGQYDYTRYKHLVSKHSVPFVRASGDQRVIDSATNWTSGFGHMSRGNPAPSLNVIIEESPNSNNTLNNGMCPNAGDADRQIRIWEDTYATNIASRLNASALGATVTAADVTNLISLCALETVANIEPSDFCGIFDPSEFESFEYYGDLRKYYGTGYGQELGPIQGVGYVNELIARLTESTVRDNTQTNRTLDSDPSTFPLNRKIYADFSHENEIVAVYGALGLFRQPDDLDLTNPDPKRTWIASYLVPFSARLVTERLDCSGTISVRMLVNDHLQPLEFCGSGDDGICTLDAFLQRQEYARNDGNGDFEKCFD
ncbi:hypothetical protein ACEPAI_5600 [Sanghuangporus weigelae]